GAKANLEDFHDKPHYPRIVRLAGAVLPRSGRLAESVDGDGQGSAAGRESGSLLPSLPGGARRFRSIAEDNSEVRRQLVGIGRRDHSRSARRSFSEKETHRADSRRPNRRRRWTAGLCHGIGGGPAAFLRFHLQETPPLPQSTVPLNPGKFTHKFRRRGYILKTVNGQCRRGETARTLMMALGQRFHDTCR